MLHISFSQLTSKRHIILNAGSISLSKGKGVLLQGDKDVVTSIFTHILYQKECRFTLEDEVLDKALLQDNIILLTSDGALPLMKKVKKLCLELGHSQAQCNTILRGVNLETKANQRILRLSKEERLLLAVQLACASQASILLLDKDWTSLSLPCQNTITELLEKYLADGNFLLINTGAKQLIPCDEQYEVVGQDMQSKQQHIASFLEEKGSIDKVLAKKQSFFNDIKYKLSFITVCSNTLFHICSVLFVSLALIVVIGFSLAIQQLDTNIDREKEREQFHLDIRVCSHEYRPEEYCYNTTLSAEQLVMLKSIEEIDRVYPTHNIYMASKGWFQQDRNSTIGLYADGESITLAEENIVIQSIINVFDASLFNIEETFENTNDEQVGIYISKEMLESNKELFSDIHEKKMSIRGSFDLPIYTQTIDNTQYSEFDVDSNGTYINEIPVIAELDLPILGIVDEKEYGWYMDEQVFYELQNEFIKQYPKDSAELYAKVPEIPIDDYQTTKYQVSVDTYDELTIIEEKVQAIDPKIRIDNTVKFMLQNKQMYTDSQAQLRSTLLPVLLLVAAMIGGFIGVSYRFQKYNFLYKFQYQKISNRWKRHLIRNVFLVSLLVSAFSMLVMFALSSISFQDMITSSIMNSSYAARQDIYENAMFSILTSIFQVFPMYLSSKSTLLVVLLFSGFIGVLRYAPTLYCYMKSRKQM